MGKYITQRDREIAEAVEAEQAALTSIQVASSEELESYITQLAAARADKETAQASDGNQFACNFHKADGLLVEFEGPERLIIEVSAIFQYDENGDLVEQHLFRDRPHYLVACPDAVSEFDLVNEINT